MYGDQSEKFVCYIKEQIFVILGLQVYIFLRLEGGVPFFKKSVAGTHSKRISVICGNYEEDVTGSFLGVGFHLQSCP